MFKKSLMIMILSVLTYNTAESQTKEALQFATLSPTLLVVSSDIEHYKKMHYTLSMVAYMGSYMITDSVWKSAVITLSLGIAKEVLHDELMGRGTPLWEDMKWNTLGTSQGVVFTISLKF